MKTKMATTVCWLVAAMALLVFSSCEHKDLCYHHPHTTIIKVQFDWTDAPDANPEGMCVFFYPTDGSSNAVRRFDFAGKEGGEIEIRCGSYRVICYNNDTESNYFAQVDFFDSHKTYTRSGAIFETIYGASAARALKAPQAKHAENERVTMSPDMMWGCTALDVEIAENNVKYICVPEAIENTGILEPWVTEQTITLYPHELICTYTYEVRNVVGLDRVVQLCGSLSSMAPALYFGSETLDRECSTIPVEALSDGVSNITGRFLTFGHHPDNSEPHRFLLYLWMTDGTKIYYGADGDRFDVTDQIHSAPDKRHVHFIIDGVDLPREIPEETNFDPTVDDWGEIREDIGV